jgi:hypothetical protein
MVNRGLLEAIDTISAHARQRKLIFSVAKEAANRAEQTQRSVWNGVD